MALIHLFVFIAKIGGLKKLEKFVFNKKQHIWPDTVLKSGCGQFWNLPT